MNAPTAPHTLAPQRVEAVALNAIAPSTTHIQTLRRARFDKPLLQELADSIKGTQGVIQPIVLRLKIDIKKIDAETKAEFAELEKSRKGGKK